MEVFDMKRIFRYIIAAVALTGLFTSCDNFTEPQSPEPVVMTPTMDIAQFKALYKGSPLKITDGSIVISGKVISTDRTGNVYRSLYIQDETGGLEVKIGKTGLYNDYVLGQTIYIKPQHLCLGAYGESVQLGAVSTDAKYETSYIDVQALINSTIFKGERGEPLSPIEISTKDGLNNANECCFVELMNASYQGGSEALKTWAVSADPVTGREAAYGQQNFDVDGMTVVVRTSGYSSFANEEVGMEIGQKANLRGILTRFRTTYQLVLLSTEDVKKL